MQLTPEGVRKLRFGTTRLRPGYEMAEVDAFLRKFTRQVDALTADNGALRDMLEQVRRDGRRPGGIAPPVRDFIADDVRRVMFKTVRMRPGYDEREVDSFLDQAEARLAALTAENDELRSQLSVA